MLMRGSSTLMTTCLVAASSAWLTHAFAKEIFMEETFGSGWEDRWVNSKAKKDYGEFKLAAGMGGDIPIGHGLKTSQDARFYAASAKLEMEFTNKDKDLVVQFTVKHGQKIDCGGGYLKVLSNKLEPENFDGDSEYYAMFGPDICGSTKKTHVILNYDGKNYPIKKTIAAKADELTHQYTLIVKPDQTYQVLIDNVEEAAGKLVDDFDFLPPKTIPDPDVTKPDDWVDEAEMDDPEDKKPEGYDDIAETIADPDAEKPEDWDDDMDGDWDAPQIQNPEYAGPWSPRKIPNPSYKGVWKAPEIDNPEYKDDKEIYVFENVGYVGFDLWQVKAGTTFDNILVTDDIDYAKTFSESSWKPVFDAESAKAKEDAEKAKEEAEAAAAAAKAAEPEDDELPADEEEDEHEEL